MYCYNQLTHVIQYQSVTSHVIKNSTAFLFTGDVIYAPNERSSQNLDVNPIHYGLLSRPVLAAGKYHSYSCLASNHIELYC